MFFNLSNRYIIISYQGRRTLLYSRPWELPSVPDRFSVAIDFDLRTYFSDRKIYETTKDSHRPNSISLFTSSPPPNNNNTNLFFFFQTRTVTFKNVYLYKLRARGKITVAVGFFNVERQCCPFGTKRFQSDNTDRNRLLVKKTYCRDVLLSRKIFKSGDYYYPFSPVPFTVKHIVNIFQTLSEAFIYDRKNSHPISPFPLKYL